MKYAEYRGVKMHAKDVTSGAIARDLWFPDYPVKACVGPYRQYWTYVDGKPELPHGYEPETEWHAAWKVPIQDDYCEVVCGDNREHRADIKTSKYVLEIQKSPINGWAVIERNNFYKELSGNRLVWIVNVAEPWIKRNLTADLSKKQKDGRFPLNWKYARKWVLEMVKAKDTFVYFDYCSHKGTMIYVWEFNGQLFGKWTNRQNIFKSYLKSVLKTEFLNDLNKINNSFNELKSG